MINKKWRKVWPIKKWQNNWRIRQDGPAALLWSIVNQLISLKLKTEKSAMLLQNKASFAFISKEKCTFTRIKK